MVTPGVRPVPVRAAGAVRRAALLLAASHGLLLLVWRTVGDAVVSLPQVLAESHRLPFDAALTGACSVALVLGSARLAVLAWEVALVALQESPVDGSRAPRGRWSRPLLVLVLSGATGFTGGALPAVAAGRWGGGPAVAGLHVLDGLPLPDRTTGPARATPPSPTSRPDRLDVEQGDTLWALSASVLGPDASERAVLRLVRRTVRANPDVRGLAVSRGDVLLPGERLRVPQARRPHPHPEGPR